MSKATSYIPKGQQALVPHLVIRNVPKAIEFYKKAFGAEEVMRLAMPDGTVMHAEIKIGDSFIYLVDEMPGSSCGKVSPETLKNCHATMHLYVPDVDKAYEIAIAAGAEGVMPPTDMFWGDRFSNLKDPFGQVWSLATHVQDLTAEEIQKGAAECMKQMAGTAK